MKYDLKYNLLDRYTLEDTYTNAEQLRKYKECENLTNVELQNIAIKIPASLWCQFLVVEWDETNIDAYGCPGYIRSINLAEWIYD